ncbi:MAG: transposase [Candidatus Fermentithermobacillus carboniphilus]|uniref:Transposase n=1 Tax=Candidatus Fermentithermobacillus carboniphilus TaxID=3085328 RepID=A0AAT9LBV2_9FIRM|nr:MAG: transposase [Candidatus Fermentithermobacillus carboniphilus]
MSLAKAAKEGLLALAVQVEREMFRKLMEIELTMKVGEEGKHNPNRQAYRHGYETGEIVLGARKVKVQRPRARTVDRRKVELEVYKAFQEEDMLSRAILERMIHGLSCRCYLSGLEDIGSTVEAVGISKSTLSRRFVEITRRVLGVLLSWSLNDLDGVDPMLPPLIR